LTDREKVARRYRVNEGSPGSPVILHVPHASSWIDEDVRARIRLTDGALAGELALLTDAHTDVVAERAAGSARLEPYRFVNLRSRLVVDPERFPDEREELLAAGMGAVYTRTSHGAPLRDDDQAHIEHLLATYYRPYAAAMTSTVDDRLAATGRAVVIDVHSYPSRALPYELHAALPRPAVCLGTDPFHTPPGLLAAARDAFAACGDWADLQPGPLDRGLRSAAPAGGPAVAENAPFAGCYVPLKHYRRDPAVTAIMVEIRRDIYVAEPGGAYTAGLDTVAAALARLIDAVTG
jgi:N-formylglutamate deformylase